MSSNQDAAGTAMVWEIYKNLTEQCEHFNGIESTYRTLTSTWLLAAFGAIGFVMKDLQGDPLLIGAIASGAAIGIYLLWTLDLLVYHRLLGAAFAELLALENRNAWLPQVAHGMMNAEDGVGVVPRVVWFYIATYAVLVAIASVALVRGAEPQWGIGGHLAGAAACFALFGVAVGRYMYGRATAPSAEQAEYRK